MKRDKRVISLLAVGLDSEFATKLVRMGHTLSKLKAASKSDLSKEFESWEVSQIIEATKRDPIPTATINKLVQESDWKCCICWDVSKGGPVVIHHIAEHSKPRDNRYENLVVLCLNHHALAHTTWQISRHPLPAPGKESALTDAFSQSDVEALEHFRSFIDRPAMHQPFNVEGNMHDFLTAITDIIRALNTGILKTREGDEIARTKPRSMMSNPGWRQKLDIVASRFEELRTRFEIAGRGGEMILGPNGFYAFHNRQLPKEIDAIRESIVLLFNELLQEARLQPITGIRPPMSFPRGWRAILDA